MKITIKEFWQARVKITQVPAVIKKVKFVNPRSREEVTIDNSWLCDPFGEKTIYGLELTIDKGFSWTFFFNGEYGEVHERGKVFLQFLKDKYPGLTGEFSLAFIKSEVYNKDLSFYELIVPQYPYLNSIKFSIIKKFISLFGEVEKSLVQLFITWQRDDS
ncbi:MAG: hypothetical protein ACTSRI_05095, partial [Promethearchaeota archaeon]